MARASSKVTLESLQQEMRAGFAEFRAEFKTSFAVLNSRIDDIRYDIDGLRKDMRDLFVTLARHDDRLDKLEHPEA